MKLCILAVLFMVVMCIPVVRLNVLRVLTSIAGLFGVICILLAFVFYELTGENDGRSSYDDT